MKNIAHIFWKEFKAYFRSPLAYIIVIYFLFKVSSPVLIDLFLIGQSSMRLFFSLLPGEFVFLAPAITMMSWAEEKKLGTIEILMTLPVKDHEVVIAKFLSSFVFLIFTLCLTFPLPLTVMALGNPDPGPIWGGYVGAFLLGGAYLAIGLFMSSLTKDQIISFIMAYMLCYLFYIVGTNYVLLIVPSVLVPFLSFLGFVTHYESIGRGVIDSRDIIYYLSVIGFFLFLNQISIESRKWK